MADGETQVEHDQYFNEIHPYLLSGKEFYNEMKRNTFSSQESYAEALCTRCRAFIQGLVSLSSSHLWPEHVVDGFCQVIREFQQLCNIYEERFHGFSGEDLRYSCPSETHHAQPGKGRPRFLIPASQLVGLRSLNFSWKAISEMLGVSEKTMLRRRHEFSMPIGENSYSDISNGELDEVMSSILAASPNSGERMILGALTARSIKVKRRRVRSSINR